MKTCPECTDAATPCGACGGSSCAYYVWLSEGGIEQFARERGLALVTRAWQPRHQREGSSAKLRNLH